MSDRPSEVDFSSGAGREATPERMHRAFDYVLGRIRAVEAVKPEFQSALETLRAVGLDRVTEVLIPIFDEATSIKQVLLSIKADWEGELLPAQVRADTAAAVTAEFADYRLRYMGAFPTAPTAREDGSPLTIGTLYFDTTLDSMRVQGAGGWKNAGSVVSGIMTPFALVATAGQTSFAIPGGYDVGMIIVAKNGALLRDTTDFTATDGANVVLTAAAALNDKISGFAFGSVALSAVYSKAQSDAKYRLVADSYTKGDVDGLVNAKANSVDVFTKSASDLRYLTKGSNLSDLTDAAAARVNLGLGGAALKTAAYYAAAVDVYTKTEADSRYAAAASTLTLTTGDARYTLKTDVYDKTAADGRFLQKGDNLAAVTDKPTARANLGLGSAALLAQTAVMRLGTGAAAVTLYAGTTDPDPAVGVDGDFYFKG